MKPKDIHKVLKGIGAKKLYHANTVSTSCTFLEQGALLSRGFVADNGLVQTPQRTDDIDKQFEIWDDVFLDHVNIHHRGGRKRGANNYGPVLFVLDVDTLLGLPPDTDIRVTRSNPIHWRTTGAEWFETTQGLAMNLQFGNFDKMLVIRTPQRIVRFPQSRVDIYLDKPERCLSSGVNAFAHALQRLRRAAKRGAIKATIRLHACQESCKCVEKYGALPATHFDTRFG